jgi:hypothetical protein
MGEVGEHGGGVEDCCMAGPTVVTSVHLRHSPSSTVACMPTMQPSPMVQPWSTTRWPTTVCCPTVHPLLSPTCTTEPSWMFEDALQEVEG